MKKYFLNLLQIQSFDVSLHPQLRTTVHNKKAKFGVVVQLVRIPACHAGGRGFESRPDRLNSGKPFVIERFFSFKYNAKLRDQTQNWGLMVRQNNSVLYCQTIHTYNPKYITQITNFIKLEAKNPIKEPAAAFRALLWSLKS